MESDFTWKAWLVPACCSILAEGPDQSTLSSTYWVADAGLFLATLLSQRHRSLHGWQNGNGFLSHSLTRSLSAAVLFMLQLT